MRPENIRPRRYPMWNYMGVIVHRYRKRTTSLYRMKGALPHRELAYRAKAVVFSHIVVVRLSGIMRSFMKKAARDDFGNCWRIARPRFAASLERRRQGADRGGVLRAGRGRVGCRAATRNIAAASFGLAQGGPRWFDASGRHRAADNDLRNERDPGSEFVKRRGFWPARRPTPRA
jgi:hypothetical protein